MLNRVAKFVKLEHTLFSLPLLFAGALLAVPWTGWHGLAWSRLGLILVAGTGARTMALALNRLLDRKLDALNPRTAGRELPTGALTLRTGWLVALAGGVIYLAAAWKLAPWLIWLTPVPVAVFIIYPLMKRFTWTAHFGVGLGLALAPLGGALGYAVDFPQTRGPLWLAAFAFCWVSGFDVLYATMDEDFDREAKLYSVPAVFGKNTALDLGLMLHGAALLCLGALVKESLAPMAGPLAWFLMAPACVLLLLEQKYGYSLDMGSPFFRINAWIGVAVALAVFASLR
jgi:4-hydroxybenzoate polyprenyltransferase